MLDTMTHGDALFEILLAGHNPYADGPLTEGETERLQSQGLSPDQTDALVIGRVVRGHRGVWALAGAQLVLLGQRYRTSVDQVARADVLRVDLETGRYGETVRLQTRQGRWAMYGVDAVRARALQACFSG